MIRCKAVSAFAQSVCTKLLQDPSMLRNGVDGLSHTVVGGHVSLSCKKSLTPNEARANLPWSTVNLFLKSDNFGLDNNWFTGFVAYWITSWMEAWRFLMALLPICNVSADVGNKFKCDPTGVPDWTTTFWTKSCCSRFNLWLTTSCAACVACWMSLGLRSGIWTGGGRKTKVPSELTPLSAELGQQTPNRPLRKAHGCCCNSTNWV